MRYSNRRAQIEIKIRNLISELKIKNDSWNWKLNPNIKNENLKWNWKLKLNIKNENLNWNFELKIEN